VFVKPCEQKWAARHSQNAMISGMLTTLRSRLAARLRGLRAGYPSLLVFGGFAIAVLVGRVTAPTTEAAFRYGGTLPEFFGMALVGFGLAQTRAAFGKPTLTARAIAWGRASSRACARGASSSKRRPAT
jgi:hypothetical protein